MGDGKLVIISMKYSVQSDRLTSGSALHLVHYVGFDVILLSFIFSCR